MAGTVDDTCYRTLLELLDRQARLGAELERLCVVQRRAIESDDLQGLMAALALREDVITQLVQGDREVRSLRARAEGAGDAMSPPERDEIARRTRGNAELLERVEAWDRQDRAAMEDKRSRLGRELARLGEARRAASAYAPPTGGVRFQDREV